MSGRPCLVDASGGSGECMPRCQARETIVKHLVAGISSYIAPLPHNPSEGPVQRPNAKVYIHKSAAVIQGSILVVPCVCRQVVRDCNLTSTHASRQSAGICVSSAAAGHEVCYGLVTFKSRSRVTICPPPVRRWQPGGKLSERCRKGIGKIP